MQCTMFDGHTFQLLKFIDSSAFTIQLFQRAKLQFIPTLCTSRKYGYLPHGRDFFPRVLENTPPPSKFQSHLWRVWIFSGTENCHFRDSLKKSSSHWEKRNSSHKKHNRMVVTFFRAVVSHLDMGLKTKERRSRSGNQSCSSFVTHNSTSFSVFFRIAFCQISLKCG